MLIASQLSIKPVNGNHDSDNSPWFDILTAQQTLIDGGIDCEIEVLRSIWYFKH
jgi:hypothetical protein